MVKDGEGLSALYARLDDLAAKAERGEVAVSQFLTPRELHYSVQYLARIGLPAKTFGGYDNAERQRIYILPEYIDIREEAELGEVLSEFGFSLEVASLEIVGSGYKTLTHRDFLGSLLGLGIDRDVLGDIVLIEEKGKRAVVFCSASIADFIETALERVGNDKVRARNIRLDKEELPQRKFAPINDTVASARLDCIVASLCSLSRAKAQEAITAGPG